MDETTTFQAKRTSKRGIILIISIVATLILGSIFVFLIINKDENNDLNNNDAVEPADTSEHFIVSEWNVKFKVPATITDIRYEIADDRVYFVARPKGVNVEYAINFESDFARYSSAVLLRSKEEFIGVGGKPVYDKKIGDYYFRFLRLVNDNTGLFQETMNDDSENGEFNREYEVIVANGIIEMFNSISAIK